MKTDSTNACPKCGAPVPPEAPEGLCPRCVLAAAVAPEPAPTATSQIPSIERLAIAFPQLQIIELIGRGGMGFVFKARQPHLDRFVALKLLPDSLAHDPQFAERFNREGRVLARLNHPNIVSIFDFGHTDPRTAALQSRSSDDLAGRVENSQPTPAGATAAAQESRGPSEGGFYYLMMEYVDGVNLRQAMRAGRFSPAEALTVVPKICEALQFAHEEGILHRDIKPENILLDAKGRVKIADFGIAKLVGEEHPDVSLTATGAALGTMHYMAPEQIEKPATVDHRADIYSLGVVFYELLTGELPLGRFGPPSAKTPVDSRVDDVVMRTLEREREKRFQSAGEMGTTVEHLTEAGAGARPSTTKLAPAAPVEDFILCHPRLPRMAQFITVLALVVMPACWLIDLLGMDFTPHPNAYAEFIQVVTRMVTFWGELLTTVLLFIGGWKLRALKKSGPRLISVAVWTKMVLIAFVIGGLIWIENLIPAGKGGDKPMAAGEAVLGALQFGALIFQIIALVWLRRNRAVLNDIFQSAATPRGPGGTMVIKPGDVMSTVPKWSRKAIWAAILIGNSLTLLFCLIAALLGALVTSREGLLIGAFPPGLAGTILGWMALSDIRAHEGKLRGLPLAVFSALTLPLGLLLLATFAVAIYFIQGSANHPGSSVSIMSVAPLLLIPVGALTFSIWAIYASARRGGNKPPSEQRGVLKWIFLGLLIFGVSVAIMSKSLGRRDVAAHVAVADTNTTPWIRFTFTAVELREVQGVRWLAIDYLDDAHGECEKSFPWETTIPGFRAETRTTEFRTDAKDSSPAVRHQRIEYRMPDSSPRDQLERLRDNLEKALKQKSFRLELGENEVPLLLFELPGAEGGSLQARIKVVPPLKIPVNESVMSNSPTGSIALTIKRAEIETQNRKLRVFFDLEENPTLGIKADADTIIKKRGAKFPTPVPGAVRRVDGHSHVAEWVLPEIFDDARLTNAQWQVNFNFAGQRFVKQWGKTIDLVVLTQYAGVSGQEGDWAYHLLLKAVPSAVPLESGEQPQASISVTGQPPLTYAWHFDGRGQLVTFGTQSLAFAPIIERVLYDYKSGKDWLLNLDSGETFSLPPGMSWDNDAAAVWTWAHQRGIHVTGLNVASQHGLYGFEMKAATVRETNVTFETVSPTQIGAALKGSLTSRSTHNGGPMLYQLSGKDWNDLYAFETDEGRAGVLQVTGFVDNPRGVKFRYKLVQSDKDTAAEIRIRLAREELDAARKKSDAGRLSQYDLAQAKRQFAIATTGGDAVAAARMNLEFAQVSLTETKRRVEIGTLAPLDLKLAESHLTLAETELREAVKAQAESTPERKMVIDVSPEEWPPEEKPPTNSLHWSFKSLIPPDHLAQILFVRWSNGVPSIMQGQSAYHKVGKTPAEVDLSATFDKHDAPQPVDKRAQWTVSLGTDDSTSTFRPEDPPYRLLTNSSRMTVRSGHQRRIPLVNFVNANGAQDNRQNGIDLRIILQPFQGPAIRSVPTEKDHGHYISGRGLATTLEETLRQLRELPIDP